MELIVVTGPPGAGKSTVARALVTQFESAALVPGDDFFAFVVRGAVLPWLPQAHDQNEIVLDAAASAAGRLAAGGYTTVYDGVVGPWSLGSFTAATGLPRLGYLVLLPSVERCVSRVARRLNHGFTDERVTRQMHHEFAVAEIAPRHVMADPPDDAATTVRLIQDRLADGSLYTG